MSEQFQRRLLGAFLRAHREGLPRPAEARARRRTPGLTREELAEAAGLSTTWITWLEQGREVSASVSALQRLAEALRLAPAERASLFDLAGKRDPDARAAEDGDIPAEVLELPRQFSGPAYVLDYLWTARAWNEAAARLFVGWLDDAPRERNLLLFVFLSQAARDLIGDWEVRARRLAAEFRADFNRRPDEPAMGELVDRLVRESPRFAEYWRGHDVRVREGGERTFVHPVHGELAFRQATLLFAMRPEIKLVCLTRR